MSNRTFDIRGKDVRTNPSRRTPLRSFFAACTIVVLAASTALPRTRADAAVDAERGERSAVSRVIRPLMARYGVPGMAVGIVANGRATVYDFGVASRATGAPVTRTTLFEIGSVTKTFTATLASYAHVTRALSLGDRVSADDPALRGTSFDRETLLNLATHTSGGLPLQVPDGIANDAQLLAYLRHWKPSAEPGTSRLYGNVGIGLLGVIAARRMHARFDVLMRAKILAPLGMTNTFLNVPAVAMPSYAQGYTSSGTPIRMAPGVLGEQTYGIRTTARDLLRFAEANMQLLPLDATLQRAIDETHAGYYRVGAMTQDLIWEQYAYPTRLTRLLDGNSPHVLFDAVPVSAVAPPDPPHAAVLLNKTGSTNGFAAYVALVPARHAAVVLLANRSIPIAARVRAAYAILNPRISDTVKRN